MNFSDPRSASLTVVVGGLIFLMLYNIPLLIYTTLKISRTIKPKGHTAGRYIGFGIVMVILGEILGLVNGFVLTNWHPLAVAEKSTPFLMSGARMSWLIMFTTMMGIFAAVMLSVTVAKNLRPVGSNEEIKKIDPWWALLLIVDFLIIFLALSRPDPFQRIVAYVLDGIWVTIYVTALSFILVLVLGLVAGLGRLARNVIVRGIATVYVEVVRGIPVLVQLMFWYFAFPSVIKSLGVSLNILAWANYKANPVGMAVLGLTFCYAAYMSEVYRAGIQSISKGQMEAARSLGMTYVQAMRHIILPQAVRVILPPVGNEFITLLKDSSLVSVVAVADMTRRGREFMAANFIPIETWVMIALLYLFMTLLSGRIVNNLEQSSRRER